MSLIHHPFTLLVFPAIQGSALLLAGRWGHDQGQQEKRKKGHTPGPQTTLPILLALLFLFSIFPSLPTFIPSSLQLPASRNYLSHCKGASSIPWFIACCQRNGSCFDWIEGAHAFVSLLGHSCVCKRWLLNERFIFLNLLKAPCLSALHLCLCSLCAPPPLSFHLCSHGAHALWGWSSVCSAVPPLFSLLFFCSLSGHLALNANAVINCVFLC